MPTVGEAPANEPAASLRAAVNESLEWNQYENATFLAERLVACDGSAANVYLLANCYNLGGSPQRAYAVLKGSTNAACRYLFARCCITLERLEEAEIALTGGGELEHNHELETLGCTNGSVFLLLGDICRKASRPEQAIQCYRKALATNPFLWVAFERLCSLGTDPDPASVFCDGGAFVGLVQTDVAPETEMYRTPAMAEEKAGRSRAEPIHTVGATPGTTQKEIPRSLASFALAGSTAAAPTISALGSPQPWSYKTPVGAGSAFVTPSPGAVRDQMVTPPPLSLTGVAASTEPAAPGPPALRKSSRLSKPVSEEASSGVELRKPVRRSGRLFASSSKRPPGGSDTVDASASELGGNSVAAETGRQAVVPGTVSGSRTAALKLLAQHGQCIAALAKFDCKASIDALIALPPGHSSTGWAHTHIGKAYFELGDYKNADNAFRNVRRIEPHRTEGMDV